jgi:hypothetical protein
LTKCNPVNPAFVYPRTWTLQVSRQQQKWVIFHTDKL